MKQNDLKNEEKVNVSKYASYLVSVIILGAVGLISIDTYYKHLNADIREARNNELKQRQAFYDSIDSVRIAKLEQASRVFELEEENKNKKVDIERQKEVEAMFKEQDRKIAEEKRIEEERIKAEAAKWDAKKSLEENKMLTKQFEAVGETVRKELEKIEKEKQNAKK